MKTLEEIETTLGRKVTFVEKMMFDVYSHDEKYIFTVDKFGNLKAILKPLES